MNADPYAPPQAILERRVTYPPMPGGIRRQILCAVYAASATVLFTVLSLLRAFGHRPPVYVAYDVIAAVVISGLAYGTYRGGRTCAMLMFLTYLSSHLWVAIRNGLTFGAPLELLILCCYAVGVLGTLRWHRLRDSHRREIRAI